jgi:predicted DNA-binding transcriptional regulator AlpA
MAQPVTTSRVHVTNSMSAKHATSMTLSLAQAAEILGIHRTTAWSLHKRGDFPVPVLKIGSSLRVVRAHLELYMSTGVPVGPGAQVAALTTTN